MGLLKSSLLALFIAVLTYRCLRDDSKTNLPGLLRGKNVIVTGASSGIGEQSALFYAQQGANVVIIARREQLLQKVVDKCKAISPFSDKAKFKYVVADFADMKSSEAAITEAIKFLGSLDYLMLNHAYILSTPEVVTRWTGSALQFETLERSLNVNFLSFVHSVSIALPHLKKTNGSICAISSFMVEIPAFTIPYAVSKSGVNTFFSGLRQELIHDNINVSVTIVHLGLIKVDHTKDTLGAMSVAQGRDMELITSVLPSTTAAQCAADLVKATVHRTAELYYPYNQSLWLLRVSRLFFSDADYRMKIFEDFMTSLLNAKKSLNF